MSIQSFFPPQRSPAKQQTSSPSPGDGFTSTELNEALNPPVLEDWDPPREYTDTDIAELLPGPGRISFRGRIVGLWDVNAVHKMPRSARGYVKLIIRDDTGAITVRLWYSRYQLTLRLGQLVTIWATHISAGGQTSMTSIVSTTPLTLSFFLGKDHSSHITNHEKTDNGSLFKIPLDYAPDSPLEGLMTLQDFAKGGFEASDAKLLVIVKSIGARKKVDKPNSSSEFVKVTVCDGSGEATLTLWDLVTASAAQWKPSHTVLLMTTPILKSDDHRIQLALNTTTYIDVNPDMPDADWLRSYATGMMKRTQVNPDFPSHMFDAATLATGDERVLYTLATIDERIRAEPSTSFSGYLSMLMTSLSLASLHLRNMAMCSQHCDIPLYSNSMSTTCKQCQQLVRLRPNPRLIGEMIDETGKVGAGEMVLDDLAWEGLLGPLQVFLGTSEKEVRVLEEGLMWRRVTVVFGWEGEEGSGRLCVARVIL